MNKILIIDDDKELCDLIQRYVLTENMEADCCGSGREGLERLKKRDYQLVVLDVMLPGMDGFETMEGIRKEKQPSHFDAHGQKRHFLQGARSAGRR